jgi:hypothetical protein
MKSVPFIILLATAPLVFTGLQSHSVHAASTGQSTGKVGKEAYDPTKDPAFAVWRSLSRRGEPESFFLVAQRYELGEKVGADLITALQYYILAAELDHQDAEAAVERLEETLSKSDRAEARERAANWSPVTDEDLAMEQAPQKAGDARSRLLAAADSGNIEMVQKLLDRGLPVDVRDDQQWTPLMLAALQGHDKLIAFLLEQGADLEVRDINGTTPLMAAASSGWLTVVKQLMTAGADMDVQDNAGETALYMAEQFSHTAVASYLAKITASPEVIKEVQIFLITKGYKLGKPDGLWGPNTEQAVQSYQKKLGLQPDGRITKEFLSLVRGKTTSRQGTSGSTAEKKETQKKRS